MHEFTRSHETLFHSRQFAQFASRLTVKTHEHKCFEAVVRWVIAHWKGNAHLGAELRVQGRAHGWPRKWVAIVDTKGAPVAVLQKQFAKQFGRLLISKEKGITE